MTQQALRFDIATRARPCTGEVVSGDLACWRVVDDRVFVMILDATGHGTEAHAVAETAERVFGASELGDPAAFLALLDERLRGTRGAAAALVSLDLVERRLTYAGVGNTSGRLLGHADVHLVCRDGILGQRFRNPKTRSMDLWPNDLLLLHSDGISGRFSVETFADLPKGEVRQLATRLLDRYGKMHDDAGCAVVRVRA